AAVPVVGKVEPKLEEVPPEPEQPEVQITFSAPPVADSRSQFVPSQPMPKDWTCCRPDVGGVKLSASAADVTRPATVLVPSLKPDSWAFAGTADPVAPTPQLAAVPGLACTANVPVPTTVALRFDAVACDTCTGVIEATPCTV